MRVEFEASARDIAQAPSAGPARTAVIERERTHLRAWAQWFDEALVSTERAAITPTDALRTLIASTRARLQSEWSTRINDPVHP
jgi:hypothetical protein